MQAKNSVLLVILDGWGIGRQNEADAIFKAQKPTFDLIKKEYPMFSLQASGIAVGLPWNEPGNSEVGHLTLGAGKILFQYLTRINNDIRNMSFFTNPKLLRATEYIKKNNSALHITGLLSSGTVHSSIDHTKALLQFAAQQNISKVFLHIITDGRDSYPQDASRLLEDFQLEMQKICPQAKIASLVGRTFAMERDNHWDRTQIAFDVLANQKGVLIKNPIEYIQSEYSKGKFDYSIDPAIVTQDNQPIGTLQENDVLLFSNFREDSMRQITQSFVDKSFQYFPNKTPNGLFVLTMTDYLNNIPHNPLFDAIFEKEIVKTPLAKAIALAKVMADGNIKQLHIAETEKYAHVTFFFNGENEKPFPGEERILVPSLPLTNFENNPEMSAAEITAHIKKTIIDHSVDFIVANYANADMVGHTGNFNATVKAVEFLDAQIKEILEVAEKNNWWVLITGDHGNADEKINLFSGKAITGHSANPVPLHIIHSSVKNKMVNLSEHQLNETSQGILSDVAPTILAIMGIPKPEEMTGKNMLELIK
jgi:2,3-bisphosphoglycerate-independent phosphoglycerate mutase